MTVAGRSLKALRSGNRAAIVRTLRECGPSHRAELARRTGLSRSAVTAITAELLAEGIVVQSAEHSSAPKGSGPRVPLVLNPSAGAVLGIDFSLDEVQVVLADLSHQVRGERRAAIDDAPRWRDRIAIADSVARQVLADTGTPIGRVVGAGLGIPGPVDPVSRIVGLSSNSGVWVGADPALALAEALGVPVAVDNTAHLGCLAEATWGAAAGSGDTMFVKLGAGVGCGLMIGGHLVRGSTGTAGELGHVTVDPAGPACRCGSRGCLEAYVAVPAIVRALAPARGTVQVTDVVEAAGSGDRATVRVLHDAGLVLGRVLASLVNVLNPSVVVIGGELSRAGDPLLDPIRAGIEQSALAAAYSATTVVPATFGRTSGALGGVARVLKESDGLVAPAEGSPG